jgi:hypothetical protein
MIGSIATEDIFQLSKCSPTLVTKQEEKTGLLLIFRCRFTQRVQHKYK